MDKKIGISLVIAFIAICGWVFITGYLFFAYKNDLKAVATNGLENYNAGVQAGVAGIRKSVVDEFNQKGFITLTDGQKTVYLDPVVPEEPGIGVLPQTPGIPAEVQNTESPTP